MTSGQEPLRSRSHLQSFSIGTGHSIITTECDSLLKSTKQELILVTCFWAASTSQKCICDLLQHLSSKALTQRGGNLDKIRVRLCFSSSSLVQKVFHTSSPEGQVYEPSLWKQKLDLPDPDSLQGLDLQVKSIFVRPFSVMHPKYFIVDRRVCVLPSCNISWERWFEGCLVMRGPVVDQLWEIWWNFWGKGTTALGFPDTLDISAMPQHLPGAERCSSYNRSTPPASSSDLPQTGLIDRLVEAKLLDHGYDRNPHFRPFPCQAPPKARTTPLNQYTLRLLKLYAKSQVWMITPNLTSAPVLAAVENALDRGVNVSIVTNPRLMRLEQIVTSGSTTPRCIRKLVLSHKRSQRLRQRSMDVEHAAMRLGKLEISYFELREDAQKDCDELEPDHLHLKVMIVDDEFLLMGSGNQDRASWYTSQELGIAIEDSHTARIVQQMVKEKLKSRLRSVYDG